MFRMGHVLFSPGHLFQEAVDSVHHPARVFIVARRHQGGIVNLFHNLPGQFAFFLINGEEVLNQRMA